MSEDHEEWRKHMKELNNLKKFYLQGTLKWLNFNHFYYTLNIIASANYYNVTNPSLFLSIYSKAYFSYYLLNSWPIVFATKQ